jgi:single-strand DNA-binding protein
MNNVNLIGHLTRDPKLKEIGGGRSVCEMRVAVNNPGRGGAPGEPTYIDVATFGKHAEACAV